MNRYIKGKRGIRFPFRCRQVPSWLEISDALRLGQEVKELRYIGFYGFQCEDGDKKKKFVGCQGSLVVQPLAVSAIGCPKKGEESIYIIGKCVRTRPGTGPQKLQVTEDLDGYVYGRLSFELPQAVGKLYFAKSLDEVPNFLGSVMVANLER